MQKNYSRSALFSNSTLLIKNVNTIVLKLRVRTNLRIKLVENENFVFQFLLKLFHQVDSYYCTEIMLSFIVSPFTGKKNNGRFRCQSIAYF